MLDAMKSRRDEMLALQKKESGVDETSDLAQANPRPGTSQSNPPTRTSDPVHLDHYGPSLPPRSTQKPHSERVVHSDPDSDHSEQCSDSKYYQVRPKHKNTLTRGNINPNPSTNLSRLQRKISLLPISEGLHNLNLRFLQNLNPRPA